MCVCVCVCVWGGGGSGVRNTNARYIFILLRIDCYHLSTKVVNHGCTWSIKQSRGNTYGWLVKIYGFLPLLPSTDTNLFINHVYMCTSAGMKVVYYHSNLRFYKL